MHEQYDAVWSGDQGSTISAESAVGPHCAPACTADFHLC